LAGAVFENAPGIGSVVKVHQAPPLAWVLPWPLTARTCHE